MANTSPKIRYTCGYKYQLMSNATFSTSIIGYEAKTEFLRLTADGKLLITKYYSWDGPSGPTIDTKNSMRGSLVHDALYQLIRLGLLPPVCRTAADAELYNICRADGMSWLRAKLWLFAVRKFATSAANPKNRKTVQVAP